MLYNDRKMAKWQGFFLSEHNEELARKKKKNDVREQQSELQIAKQLEMGFQSQRILEIQLNFIENGEYLEALVGVVSGFSEGQFILQTEGQELITIDISLIRHIEELETVKWFQ